MKIPHAATVAQSATLHSASAHTPNAFHWRGPSTLTDSMGRIKSQRQVLLDATRVNPERADCAAHVGMSKQAAI